ncbi:hypothetical protein [Lysinibacillus sp. D4A3_S15]|nr:hypothetical protein [Lysinibacillus sp. D4A3_S15]
MVGPTVTGVLANATNSYQYSLVGAATVVVIGALSLLGGVKYEKSK